MTSVASAAAAWQPAFHDGTALQAVKAMASGGFSAPGFLVLPSQMEGFVQTGLPREEARTVDFGTSRKRRPTPVTVRTIPGRLASSDGTPRLCPCCRGRMEGCGTQTVTLWHLPMGMCRTRIEVARQRWACRACGHSCIEGMPFKAAGHRLTMPLLRFVQDLLALGQTLKAVSLMTGLGKNVVKAIDRARLEALYTEAGEDGGLRLKRPDRQARHLGTDEFRLHDGHRHATAIIDLETGHVLWLAHGKKKQVVYDFCDHVGEEWMSGVAGIACDMNADFERAFLERHPHLAVIYDHFHLVRNFNDKVISEVRKDEQRRLRDEGDEEGARGLKNSKYILMSSPSTRRAKDRAARAGKAVTKGSGLFGRTETPAHGGSCQRCRDLLERNELLAACGIVKDMLAKAYACRQPKRMRSMMEDIAETCRSTGNRHFAWFARLVEGHMEGIVAHARHQISSGRVEGTNGMIKTLRRCGYGYPDDEYFFLKIFDASRRYSA